MEQQAHLAQQTHHHSDDDGGHVSQGMSQRSELIARIREFLLRHNLAVTGENLLRVHGIVSGADPRLARLVSAQECSGQPITQQFLDHNTKPLSRRNETASQFLQLAVTLDRSILQFGESTRTAQEAASHYSDELERTVATVAAKSSENVIIADFARIAQTMLDQTRVIEMRMKEGEAEAAQLRINLEQARAEASADPLTGLPNRRAFQQVFEEESAAAKANAAPLSLAICDIDFFKLVNDTHGHEIGDRVICAVGKTLNAISDRCHVARHGGEEFVLLFCGQDQANATQILDEARQKFAAKRLVDRITRQPIGTVTFSGGVANAMDYESLSDAMRAADEALYRAKQAGRNRIETDQPAS